MSGMWRRRRGRRLRSGSGPVPGSRSEGFVALLPHLKIETWGTRLDRGALTIRVSSLTLWARRWDDAAIAKARQYA